MADFAFPSTLRPSTSSFRLVSNTQTFESPLDGSLQVKELPGAKWHATLTFNKLNADDGRELIGFLAGLRGRAKTFTLHDHSLETPRGIATGTPLVNGASQTGTSLITDGWTPSQTGILKRGDMFQIGSELKVITQDVNSDGGGNATLIFQSALRTSPANNATIIVNSPKGLFRLASDEQARYDLSAPTFYGLQFSCIEVINA